MATITAFRVWSESPEKISFSALVMLVLHAVRIDLLRKVLLTVTRISLLAVAETGKIFLHWFDDILLFNNITGISRGLADLVADKVDNKLAVRAVLD